MSPYAVILEGDWLPPDEFVPCYFVEDSLRAAIAHNGDVVQQGNADIQYLPRANFKETHSQITLTVIDSYGNDRRAMAVICVSEA